MTAPEGPRRRRERVLVEFTKSTKASDGTPLRAEGDMVWVDPASAESFCDGKAPVAKRVPKGKAEKVEAGAAEVEQTGPVGGVG